QQNAVAFRASNKREAQTGVARCGLNNRAARPQFALVLRSLDHRQRNPILDRASWVLVFKFEEKLTGTGIELCNLHQRRVADEREDLRWAPGTDLGSG